MDCINCGTRIFPQQLSIMRNRNRRWILFWFLVSILQLASSEETSNSSVSSESNVNDIRGDPNARGISIPRMDYDQWKPLGRGDPLKNDPTYDYVPPVLDRVHYWVDPALRKPDPPIPGENQKTEILLLGITSKKPAVTSPQADSRRDTYDPYIKYVPGTNYNSNSNQRIARPSFLPSVPSSFFPSFFPPNKNKYLERAPFSKGTEQRLPYTMLMPPPVDTKNSINPLPETPGPVITQKPTPVVIYTTSLPTTTSSPFVSSSSSSVTVQAANLVYQSSSLSDGSEWSSNKDRDIPATSSIIWEPSTTTKETIPDYREELVYNTHLAPPTSFIDIEFASQNYTNKPLIAADSNQNINYVTAPPLLNSPSKEVMFKGQVTDDNLDISNTYVKIGKPEAEMHSTGLGLGMSNAERIVQHPMAIVPSNTVVFPHVMKPSLMTENTKIPPLTMQTLQEMQTMHPPPVTQSPVFTKSTNAVIKILEKEKSKPIIFKDLSNVPETANYVGSGSSVTNTYVTLPTTTTEKLTTTATTTEPPTTSTTSLTTDPLFKHYKQPMEPLKGPLYLIIQGHSKVKTYGPSKQINGILIQDSNEISDDKYERNDFEVKHLHGFSTEVKIDDQSRKARSGNIQTLKHVIQTGLGAVDFSDIEEVKRRSDGNFQEADLQVGYEVAEEENVTTEKYHKGVVEEARKLNL